MANKTSTLCCVGMKGGRENMTCCQGKPSIQNYIGLVYWLYCLKEEWGNDPRQTFYSEINFQISKLQSNRISLMDVLCTIINVNFMENI